jgi:predicted MFS family arabinose efflux permease
MAPVVEPAIAMGWTPGGLLSDGIGYGATLAASAALLLAAAVLAYITARAERSAQADSAAII